MTIKEITILAFVKSINEELNVKFTDEENYFETATNTINLNLSDIDDCGFLRHLHEIHKCKFTYDFPLALWTILHEIGHYETEWELLEDDDEAELRFWLSLTGENDAHNTTIQDKYYNLTAEWCATEWAIEWIEDNFEYAKMMGEYLKGV